MRSVLQEKETTILMRMREGRHRNNQYKNDNNNNSNNHNIK